MGMILKDDKEVDINILFEERDILQKENKLQDIFNNEMKEKIKTDIRNNTYTDLKLKEDYNTAYSLALIYIELIQKNKLNIKKVLNYTHNLPIFLTIFPMLTVLSQHNIKQKLILQPTWFD